MSGKAMDNAALERPAGGGRKQERPRDFDLRSDSLAGTTVVSAPAPAAPFWREQEGRRHSYGSLRCGLDAESAGELSDAQLEAICRIAAGALAALERGDQRETARLAMAAGRLCQEIAGHWPPSAVEIPRH